MLKHFENVFEGFAPKPQDIIDADTEQKLEKLRDIDDDRLNSLEKKVVALWEDKSLDFSAKYKKIFLLFFDDFCKKMGTDRSIKAEIGQWIQSALERFGLMEIPVSTMLRETATIPVRPEFEQLKLIFNRELSGREAGALSTIRYVKNRQKEITGVRICTNGTLDKFYSIDGIEIPPTKNGETPVLFLTQVKTNEKIPKDKIEEDHAKHALYLKKITESESEYTAKANIEKSKEQDRPSEGAQVLYGQLDDIQILIDEYLEAGIELDYETIISKVAEEFNTTQGQLWAMLYQLYENAGEYELLEDLLPLLEYAHQNKAEEKQIELYGDFTIVPSKYGKIVSRIVSGDTVLSERILQ